jgi:hypothetical protein
MEFMQQMNCLDMISNPARKCMSCKKGQYLSNIELTCKFCNKIGCEACSDSSCQRCGEGLFDNQLSGLCQPCFYGCRSCTSSKYDSCDSCLDGFYWRPTEYNTHGQCSPCHPSCKTCTGPSENQCSEFARGKFAIDFGSPLNQTLDCDSSCGHCEESATKCTSCYISDSFHSIRSCMTRASQLAHLQVNQPLLIASKLIEYPPGRCSARCAAS